MQRVEDLLVHAGLVRSVARAVLRGDDRVEDVVQDTWLASMGGGPSEPGAERGWLARVARRLALTVRRRDASRRRRETAPRGERVSPAATDIAEREEARRRVLDALLALEEPFREAVLLRYYDGLAPREIAARLGVPVETARSRVKRGLERLRERLVARSDERDRRSLAALAALPTALAGPVLGGLAMKKAVALLVPVLFLGGAGLWFATRTDRPATPAPAAPPNVFTAEHAPPVPALAATPHGERPSAPSTPEEGSPAAAGPTAPRPTLLRGRIEGLDARLPGLAAVTVRGFGFRGKSPTATPATVAAGDGTFTVDVESLVRGTPRAVELDVQVDHPSYALARARVPLEPPHPGLARETRITLLRAAVLSGTVTNEAGAPVVGAVAALLTEGTGDRPTIDATRTGPDGAFRLRVGGGGPYVLAVDAPDLRPTSRREQLVVGAERDLGTLVLERGASIEGTAAVVQLPGMPLEVAGHYRGDRGSALVIRDRSGFTMAELRWHGDRLEKAGPRAKVDENGSFRCAGLEPGPYVLDLRPAWAERRPPPRVHQDLMETSRREVHAPAVGVRLEVSGAFLVVSVRSRTGPLEKATGEVGGFSEEEQESSGTYGLSTDAAGQARILVRPGASYRLSVEHPGYVPAERTVRAPAVGAEQDESFVLEPVEPPKRVLSVRLVGPDGREADLERAEFRLLSTSDGEEVWNGGAKRKDGRFALADLPAGRHRLVSATATMWLGSATPFLPADQVVEVAEDGTTSVDVRLALGGWLVLSAVAPGGHLIDARCRVLDASGAARESFFMVRSAGGSHGSGGRLSTQGAAHVEPPLPPGTYSVELSHPDFADARATAIVRAGEATSVEVRLTPR